MSKVQIFIKDLLFQKKSMIPEDKIEELKSAFENSAKPLVFFDDDPDGVCSFLLFYKMNPEARGVIFKAAGSLDETFLTKIKEHHPDKVFILDVPKVKQEFIEKSGDTYWLDHHSVTELKGMKYYNPMQYSNGEDNRPTSYWAYKVTQDNLWIAMVGCTGDWFIAEDLRAEFEEKYPDLLPKEIKEPQDALFNTELGKLARIFSFSLKGKTKDAMTCVKVLTRINDPYEILNQTSSKGRFIYKKYEKINKIYQDIKSEIQITDEPLILFEYSDDKMSLTSDLSNEILYEHPEKFIIIARSKGDDMRCSLRSTKYEVRPILEKALEGLNGSGGGHLHACGANIAGKDFENFIENIKSQL